MRNYTIKTVQRFPINMETAWDFFSSPRNLSRIVPEKMSFEILSNTESEKMFAGQVITYYLRPLLGIKIFWMTEITHCSEGNYFVDEQRFGPYALWHHKHFFKAIDGGVEVTDIVDYKLPLGIFGKFAHWLFVDKQLKEIFEYRQHKLVELLGEYK